MNEYHIRVLFRGKEYPVSIQVPAGIDIRCVTQVLDHMHWVFKKTHREGYVFEMLMDAVCKENGWSWQLIKYDVTMTFD